MARPRVFVSSTYYDLRHIRDRLDAFIESVGYEAVLFESGDIPFHHDTPADISCYAEIQNCHMLVLIVGGRYGSKASGDPETLPIDSEATEKMYEAYNSITRKEYLTARDKDIPVFIFVEKGVFSEYRTYKRNRNNKSIQYAHVDNISVFKLLDDILSQSRNNFIKDFDRFDDIAAWLREQWSGLFADLISRTRVDTTFKDLSSQVTELRQVTSILKEYAEVIIRKIQPLESEELISRGEKSIERSRANRFATEPLISYMLTSLPETDPVRLYNVFVTSKSFEEFVRRSGISGEPADRLLKDWFDTADKDFRELRLRYMVDGLEDSHLITEHLRDGRSREVSSPETQHS